MTMITTAFHEPRGLWYHGGALAYALAAYGLGFAGLMASSWWLNALAVLAVSGREDALVELIQHGGPTHDPVRAPIALALGTVALRNAPLLLKVLEAEPLRDPAIELLRDAFDMLEEDFDEERFFATVRRSYWQAAAGSPARAVADALIRKLEF